MAPSTGAATKAPTPITAAVIGSSPNNKASNSNISIQAPNNKDVTNHHSFNYRTIDDGKLIFPT
ncbi:hypothetical protein RIVM261_002660 [Rivularia sp. IAM M-261]|nr:hypothetical protein CAL7716_055370 [Calothrix sp. PCC 7716]GJD15310.1 hypothetical protein RIVM261_002660 [Rivularia sp. IAM M-261]